MKAKPSLLLIGVLIILSLLVSACGSSSQASAGDHLNMAPLEEMPAEVQSAPVTVHEAYQFAVANPEVVSAIPCYCGCGAMGHTSNYSCYVAGQEGQEIVFDNHALGCSICVDITQDAMRLTRDGKSPGEIFTYIDSTFAQYGPSNMQ